MAVKPFKPPSIVRPCLQPEDQQRSDSPPAKKRRISQSKDDELQDAPKSTATTSKVTNIFRRPLLNAISTNIQVTTTSRPNQAEVYYTVLWRKFTTKKNKTWDGDGKISVSGGYATLLDVSGRQMGRTACEIPLVPGSTLSIGGKDIEIDSVISRQEFITGKIISDRSPPPGLSQELRSTFKPPNSSAIAAVGGTKIDPQSGDKVNATRPRSRVARTAFKTPLLSKTVLAKSENVTEPVPRHDPNQEGALVMKRPKQVPKGKKVVDVVVDPILCKHLRDHQRKGVSFLYECIMGMRDFDGEGAVLADEMGLGKTLQTIALIWTLLKQNPIYEEPPVIKKALIVCPVTLINNWRREFRKWLGNERIGVFVADDKKTRITDFTLGKSYSVMVIGYEKLRAVQEDLKKGAGIDIVIADEGHRLKTAQNKSAMAIKSLNTERRIILSGTPVQNDLSEFFTMVDFVNPGLLGRYNTFKREFEGPIIRSRQPEASAKDIEKGEVKSTELAALTGQFILRRTAEILSEFLPPKTEYVLFCRPTCAQADVYRSIITSPAFGSILGSPEASLQLINILKKVCNSPSLLKNKNSEETPTNPLVDDILSCVSRSTLSYPGSSAKLQVLDNLLHYLHSNSPQEKVVLVSNYTSTLDMVGTLLTSLSYPFLRLDGTTPASQRQSLVDRFNRTPSSVTFAFLLSAKSGGTGLNLIGASRLVLFDADWNPATDAQAMARIHRDGQKRPVVIYRLILKGAMDEKIFQRQRMKMGLADAVVDGKKSAQGFSKEELKDLFRLEEGPGCRTHELLGCPCRGSGRCGSEVEGDKHPGNDDGNGADEANALPSLPALIKASQVDMGAQEWKIKEDTKRAKSSKAKEHENMQTLMQYRHVDTSLLTSQGDGDVQAVIEDDILLDLLKDRDSRVDFLFAKTSGYNIGVHSLQKHEPMREWKS